MNVRAGQHSSRPGFTLLEAVLALSVLAAILVVTLQLRAQSMSTAQSIRNHQSMQRDIDAILESLDAGTLGQPEINEESRVRTWTGMHLSEPFTLTATPVLVPSPLKNADGSQVTRQVPMFRYALTYRDETVTFLSAK